MEQVQLSFHKKLTDGGARRNISLFPQKERPKQEKPFFCLVRTHSLRGKFSSQHMWTKPPTMKCMYCICVACADKDLCLDLLCCSRFTLTLRCADVKSRITIRRAKQSTENCRSSDTKPSRNLLDRKELTSGS